MNKTKQPINSWEEEWEKFVKDDNNYTTGWDDDFLDEDKVKQFISQLLEKQREELIEKLMTLGIPNMELLTKEDWLKELTPLEGSPKK